MKLLSILLFLIGLRADGLPFFACFWGGNSLGGQGDNKSSSSTTDASTKTTVTTTNQQVGASEGSTAIGAGASVTVTSADPTIMAKVLEANTNVSKSALDSNNITVKDALAYAGERGSSVDSLISKLLDKNPTPANETGALLSGVSSVVASNMGAASKTVETTSNKSLIIGIAAFASLAGLLYFFKPQSR